MYPTVEVRWFFPGSISREMEVWFQRGTGGVIREPARVDRYLALPDRADLNVKFREGRIEIKQRVGHPTIVRFHERAAGAVEHWRKWSFELVEPANARASTVPTDPSWIEVRKERRLRTYQVRDGEDVVPQATANAPAHGCELELTRVDAAGETWWTLAFEAFGDESILRKELLLVARHVLCSDEPPPLQAAHSQGYAAWLTSMGQAEAFA